MDNMFRGAGAPLSSDGFQRAATDLGAENDTASLWAILAVETRGFGYLRDRRPKVLFERHIFHKRTRGRFSAAHPDISNPKRGGYSGGPAEYARLAQAIALDATAAIESASWGLGQVMGFNAPSLGYASAMDMVEHFKGSEDAQLEGCARFIAVNPALRAALGRQDWARVAFYYNGPSYADNAYDNKLADAHGAYVHAPPGIDIRANQARLFYAGFDPKGIDGMFGTATASALAAFQDSLPSLKPTGTFDAETTDALAKVAGV